MMVRTEYERLIYTLPTRYPSIHLSTLVLVPRVYELLNFQQGVIETYRYKVSRCHPPFTKNPLPEAAEYCGASYPGKEKLYWYDSWPHPNTPSLATTFPHHKHIPPDIKHHRIPAQGLSFDRPNLLTLITEIERDLLHLELSTHQEEMDGAPD